MKKRADIEFLRVLSAFAIVWFHSGAVGHELAYSGLIVFLILSMYLGGGRGGADVSTVRRRFERLLVPWFFWCVVYAGLNIIRGTAVVPVDGGVIAGVLAGPSIHLWYMPYIFMCLLVFDIIKGYLSPSCIAVGSAIAAFLILSTLALWRPASMQLVAPLPQWLHASAAVFLGVFFLHFEQVPRLMRIALSLAILSTVVYAIPVAGVGIPYLVGLAVGGGLVSRFLAGFKFELRLLPECMLGVYFIHVFVMLVFLKFFAMPAVLLSLAVFFFSTLIVMFVRTLFPGLTRYWS